MATPKLIADLDELTAIQVAQTDYLVVSDVSDTPVGKGKKLLVSAVLNAITALTTTSFGRALLAAADAAGLRTLAGLGTAATQNTSAFDSAGAADAALTSAQSYTNSLAALTAMRANNLSDLANAGTARTNLGLGTLATQNGTFSGTSSGTNTGDQTAVSGNAGTATALATGRTIAITGDLAWTSPSFDGTGNVTAAGTLATVNANVGSFGSSTAITTFTVNAKGLVTAASTAVVVAPAGTLTGTTLAANVVATSITSTGTLTGGSTGAGFTVALSVATITGTLPAAQMPALTGDVTTSAGAVATTIAANAVTLAKQDATGRTYPSSCYVQTPANGTFTLTAKAVTAGTINAIKGLKTSAGTCTLTVKIGSTNVTGIASLSVTSSAQDATATAANTFAVGDRITLVIASASSAADLEFTLSTTRTG